MHKIGNVSDEGKAKDRARQDQRQQAMSYPYIALAFPSVQCIAEFVNNYIVFMCTTSTIRKRSVDSYCILNPTVFWTMAPSWMKYRCWFRIVAALNSILKWILVQHLINNQINGSTCSHTSGDTEAVALASNNLAIALRNEAVLSTFCTFCSDGTDRWTAARSRPTIAS